jgi:hypothetical protein
MTKKTKTIKVAVLASEPLGWGSGKHYFPVILNGYSWETKDTIFSFTTEYIYDKDIRKGKLNISRYDVLLAPGGGVGDGQAVMKGFNSSFKVRKWKKEIRKFIEDGGGFVGICGGSAMFTDLDTGPGKKPTSFLERQYNKSGLGISCVKHYYKDLAFPLFYPFQRKHPEKIGATAYVFSFAPGETKDNKIIHTGGVPIDFIISKNNPIFSDYSGETLRIRWWGGPGLIIPESCDHEVKILASYPDKDISENSKTKIYAWRYAGGFTGLVNAFFKSIFLAKLSNENFMKSLEYTYYLARPWKKSNKIIDLGFSNKPCMTSEIYPNENKGRILLCSAHPEYMIWWDGQIEEVEETKDVCLATGLHRWKEIKPLSKTMREELTYTWWLVRRIAAWAGKVPDNCLPPIELGEINKDVDEIISKNIVWDETLINQMKNI